MDKFEQRKNSILNKKDKSAKANWDKKIISLCKKINLNKNYYTTSSCSGKSVILEEKTGKDGTYYFWCSHELLSFTELKNIIPSIVKNNSVNLVKFKTESPIIYVVCKDLCLAKELLEKSIKAGFKDSGIKLTNKLIAVEIKSAEKIECPIIKNKKILVSDEFLKEIVKNSNEKRKTGWKKIKTLFYLIE